MLSPARCLPFRYWGLCLSGLFGKNPYRTWIALGGVNEFPENNTRLATFRNPFVKAWDGADR